MNTCALVLAVLVGVAMAGPHPDGGHGKDMWKKQTCLDMDKVKEAVKAGGGDCGTMMEGGPKGERHLNPKMEKGYDCVVKAFELRDTNDATIVANLDKAIDAMAKSADKAQAIKTIYKTCNGADPIPKEDREALWKCVWKKIKADGTCKAADTTTA